MVSNVLQLANQCRKRNWPSRISVFFNLLKKDVYKLAFRSVFEMVFRLCADTFVSKRPWIVNQLPV